MTRVLPSFRASLAGLLTAAALISPGAAGSAEAELDMDLMQTIEDLNKSLASHIALRDAKGSRSDASELHQLFIQVEGHFAAKPDAQDAVDLAKKSKDLSAAIVQQVGRGDFEAATDAATGISRACRACHTFYKKS